MTKILFTGLLLAWLAGAATGQERLYDFSFAGEPVERVIAAIERASGTRFAYPSSLLARFPAVTGEFARATLRQVLDAVFVARGITYKLQGDYIILGKQRRPVTVSGTVKDAESRETLIGATVYNPASRRGTATNEHGFYSLSLEEEEARLVISFVGYAPFDLTLALTRDTVIAVELQPSIQLEEVTVIGESLSAWIRNVQPGQVQFPVKVVNNLPSLLSESDVLKTLQLLPGVKTGNEGLAGLHVRGGNADENLYLMDGIPVYNPSHLMGFFSTFNSNVIKRVDFYKGTFPARYGGRLSSVVDVRLKEGNMQEVHGNLSVGLLASKFDLEGPLERGKTSFQLSARRTYMDLFLPSLLRSVTRETDGHGWENYSTGRYHFTDLNAKITRKFRGNDQLSLSVYWGKDYMNYINRSRIENTLGPVEEGSDVSTTYTHLSTEERNWKWGWGNFITLLEYGSRVTERLYGRYLLAYNRYVSTINVKIDSTLSTRREQLLSNYTRSLYHSGIEDVIAKVDFEYNLSARHTARFGGEVIYHTFTPEVSNFTHLSTAGEIDTLGQEVEMKNRARGGELSLFAEDEIVLNHRTRLHPGVRLTLFRAVDATYFSAEPRLSFHYAASDRLSLKASYSAMSQYIHLLAFGGVSLPSDLWVPVTRRIPPMRSRQVALGIYYRPHPGWEFTAETYYKTMKKQIECIDGATILPAYRAWEENVTVGEGRARGVELQLQRQQGRTTGWVNYTLAWADRRFPGINRGKRFPARNDSRHGVNVVVMHRFSEAFDASAAWVYNSGARATIALEMYDMPKIEGVNDSDAPSSPGIPHVEYRNNYQLPDYHRLDASVNYHRQKRWGTATWSVSVYNLYSRKNPFFVYMDGEVRDGTRKSVLRQASLFPVIPSFAYSITF
ncbi:MAG: TonB-dependent receptor [Odoribacteraceae bacterium]|jgi:outer membrane receptor for ferrienterochelin and colicin|nr:TonB-dependent receptor [Odoribacteraceae bacterium]